MHVAGTQNIAADFLSKIDLNPKERVELKIRNDIRIRTIQVNLQSTDETLQMKNNSSSFQKKPSKPKKNSYCKKNKQDRTHAARSRRKSNYHRNSSNTNQQGILYLRSNTTENVDKSPIIKYKSHNI